MQVDEVLEWIGDDAEEMARFLREADAGAEVTTCPGWTTVDLADHVARGAGWYVYNLSTPAADWTIEGLMTAMSPPDSDHLASAAAFIDRMSRFLELPAEIDLDQATWCFGETTDAGWWIRRAATEMTAHLIDAASLAGGYPSTSAERHAESVDELVTELFPRFAPMNAFMSLARGENPTPPAPLPASAVGLVATDVARSWRFEAGADGTAVVVEGDVADLSTVGTASSHDLLAWLLGRPLSEPLRVDGDPALLDSWNLLQRGAGVH